MRVRPRVVNGMARSEDQALTWARAADILHPVRWGDVEAVILSQHAPQVSSVSGPNPVFGLPLYLAGASLYGAPVIGLGIVVAMSKGLIEAREWTSVVFYIFLISTFIPLFTVTAWARGGRRRGWWSLLQAGASATASLVAYLILRSDAVSLDSSWTTLLTLTAAAAGLGSLAVMSFGSRSWRRHTPRRLRPRSPTDVAYNGLRAQVLEVLVKRGIVDEKDIDIPEMLNMPIGSWRELDG